MKAGAIMRAQSHAFHFRIGAAILLFGVVGTAAARADETVDNLNHLSGDYEIRCGAARAARDELHRLNVYLFDYYLGKFRGVDFGEASPPKDHDEFLRNAPRHDALEEIVPALDQACDKARQSYGQALGEAIATQWLEQLPTSADVTKPPPPATPPPTPAIPPASATDRQCNELYKRAFKHSINGGIAERLGGSSARAEFSKALALYRKGSAVCKHGGFPALFAQFTQATTKKLRALGGRP